MVHDGATQKKRAAGEAAETEAAGTAAVDRVEADIAENVPKTLRKKAKRLVDLNNPCCQPEQIARDILHIARQFIRDEGVKKSPFVNCATASPIISATTQ